MKKYKLRLKSYLEINLLFISIIFFIALLNNIFYVNIVMQEIIVIITTIAVWKLLKNESISFIGISNINLGYKDLLLGFAIGSISMVLVFLIIITFGKSILVYSILTPRLDKFILLDLMLFILVGFAEEIVCRGYIVTILNRVETKYMTAFISSTIFALMHILNPNVTLLSLINIFLVGLLFCYMRFKFKNLWMPIGYHIAWNYFEGTVFGFQVSGTVQESVYKTQYIQPNIINGGLFGPEGGLAVTFVIILSFIVLNYFHAQGDKYNA